MQTAVKTQPLRRYKVVSDIKSDGATYTPSNLARFVAVQMAQCASLPTKEVHVLDPAIGDGELVMRLLEEISMYNKRVIVHGFDINPSAIELTRSRLSTAFPHVDLCLEVKDFLAYAAEKTETQTSLFSSLLEPMRFDLVIANPPYVRTQIMGAQQAQELSARFGLNGKVDLYHAFLVAIAQVLKPTGTAGIIVSNRFMTTKGGASLRRALRTQLNLRHVWDLGDTKIFDAAVLPAVILAQGCKEGDVPMPLFTSIYETDEPSTSEADDAIEALSLTGNVALRNGRSFRVQHGTLDKSGAADDLWRIATDITDSWLTTVQSNTWSTFGDIGKIRVGVKTCADKVFIRSDWHDFPKDERPELLRPLTTHHGARRFRASTAKKHREILYPHESVNGQRQAVDLASQPKSRAYLEAHRSVLESRTYVIEGGRRWYEIWVPQDPAAWDAPKLVFRDISERPTFWLDLDGTIVNGDCYWLTSEKGKSEDLLWLAAAVANSKFIEAFYDHRFNNKLYAGRRRFMTQYVEKFPLPNPQTELAQQIVELTKQIYVSVDEDTSTAMEAELDALIWNVFGLGVEEVTR